MHNANCAKIWLFITSLNVISTFPHLDPNPSCFHGWYYSLVAVIYFIQSYFDWENDKNEIACDFEIPYLVINRGDDLQWHWLQSNTVLQSMQKLTSKWLVILPYHFDANASEIYTDKKVINFKERYVTLFQFDIITERIFSELNF